MKVTMHDIETHHPDREMPPISRECAPLYWLAVASGERIAADCDVTFLGLCRNSMPQIQLNTQRLERLGAAFKSWRAFIYENDSEDGTDEHLRAWAAGCKQATVETVKHDRPQLSSEKSRRRTDALAEYRNRCREWAKEHAPQNGNHRIIVIDMDTWGGWSDDGVMTGLHWLQGLPGAAGMASVSTVEMQVPGHPAGKMRIHYDSWAFRLNHWAEHDMSWFPYWYPPVGSHPVACNSAFGGMAIYRPDAFFAGTYSGGDCEHVAFHRTIQEATTMRMWLNPSQRMVMNWMPSEPSDEGHHGDH
jgi:hypothetical protein